MPTKKLTDSYEILKFLFYEAFHNLFSNPIFEKKRNRYILLLLITTAYIGYYLFNISELNQVFVPDEEVTNQSVNFLFSSLTNTIIIIAGVIYILVTVSFSLTTKMKYLLKILPFEKYSILLGTLLFKLLLSYGFFLIIFAILVPMLKLFAFPLTLNILILIYCQVLFFASTILYYFLFHTICYRIRLTKFNINIILLVILLFFYFFLFRFKIDQYMMESNFTINYSFVSTSIVSLIILICLFSYAIIRFKSNDDSIYSSSDFFLIKRMKHMNYFMVVFLGFIRNKLTLALIGIISLISILAFLDTRDVFIALETLIYTYPVVSFAAIRYFSTTSSYRKMKPLFKISVLQETLVTTLVNIVVNLPLILSVIILLERDLTEMLYFGIILFESAIIMSIIFPKQKSSVNEFGASVLCIVLATALYLISSNVLLFGVIFSILLLIKDYLLGRSAAIETI